LETKKKVEKIIQNVKCNDDEEGKGGGGGGGGGGG